MKDLSKWGRWGQDDELGAANLITPAKRKAAQAAWETLEAEINKVWDQVGPRLQAEHRQMQQQMMQQMQAAQPANAS